MTNDKMEWVEHTRQMTNLNFGDLRCGVCLSVQALLKPNVSFLSAAVRCAPRVPLLLYFSPYFHSGRGLIIAAFSQHAHAAV